jgi:D-tyrosyl-tRNA(Tyr) deacylase
MRAVVQRVTRASVTIEGAGVGAIERGLLVYLGVGRGDDDRASTWMLDKILGLRIFTNDENKMDRSVLDIGGGKLLIVSQFTLYGDVSRGRRPSFDGAMPPADAKRAYDRFVEAARGKVSVETGKFGASMQIESVNDGPVTIWLDTGAG